MAVIAATDIDGALVGFLIKEFSIKKPDIIQLLNMLAAKLKMTETYIFLDNLRAHHSKEVKCAADRNKQKLLFNGAYSSELNPIEILWAYAKRSFKKSLMTVGDYKDANLMRKLVEEAILQVPEN